MGFTNSPPVALTTATVKLAPTASVGVSSGPPTGLGVVGITGKVLPVGGAFDAIGRETFTGTTDRTWSHTFTGLEKAYSAILVVVTVKGQTHFPIAMKVQEGNGQGWLCEVAGPTYGLETPTSFRQFQGIAFFANDVGGTVSVSIRMSTGTATGTIQVFGITTNPGLLVVNGRTVGDAQFTAAATGHTSETVTLVPSTNAPAVVIYEVSMLYGGAAATILLTLLDGDTNPIAHSFEWSAAFPSWPNGRVVKTPVKVKSNAADYWFASIGYSYFASWRTF